VFRYLIDQAIMHRMDDPDRSAYYLLDEIEHLDATIKRLGELINVSRGVNCQAILSLQSIAQLEATYGKERAHALLSGMVTVIGLRTADEEGVDFLREAVGTSFE
jgi:type IV secretory pathway TraG/TraD family ATPase VirD4